jgi:drug/metabolite transporter (DMT)-like permease
LPTDAKALRLGATVVIVWIHALAVFGFLLIWIASLRKLRDYGRTIVQVRGIAKWYALASLFGGPIAIFGSTLAMGEIGPAYAAIASLFYPVVGALLAWRWYREKITRRSALGMAIIMLGGVAIYGPGLVGGLDIPLDVGWLGYLGGIMAAIGWGVEGAVAGRAIDVTDPDVGITIRFTAEIGFWSLLIGPALIFATDLPIVWLITETLANPWAVTWIVLAAAIHAYSYTAWYKCFPLIGVGRGLAIGNLYAVSALIFIAVFTLDLPPVNFLVGLACAILGGFVMYFEDPRALLSIRAVEADR